jgi:phosphatidylglycerol:prolipoprotein diacylglycerol transferase
VGSDSVLRIIHDFDPVFWRIDGFAFRWYSLPYVLGFLLAFLFLRRAVRRDEIPNLDGERVYFLMYYLMAGILIGARFFHVFIFEYSRYGFDPLAWIAIWRGGQAFHGGLFGAILATFLFCRRYKVAFYDLADRVIIITALALALGRIANFINGEMPGTPYAGPFCVDYSQSRFLQNPPQGCRHPTQLYEMLKNGLLFGFLYALYRYRKPRPGVIFWSFVALYGLIRFWLMFIRDESQVWMGLTLSQILSALMAVLGLTALVMLRQRAAGAGNAARA